MTDAKRFPQAMNQQTPRKPLSEAASAIVEAATPLFAEHGFEGVSIAQIARAAGVGKATVFHHFASKDELYQAVLWQVSERTFWLVEEQSWREGSLETVISGFIRQKIDLLAEGDELLRIVRREQLKASEEGMALMSSIFQGPFLGLREYLEERRVRGDLAADTDVWLLSWMIMDAGVRFHEGRQFMSIFPGFESGQDPDLYSRHFARQLLNGCLAQTSSNEIEDQR